MRSDYQIRKLVRSRKLNIHKDKITIRALDLGILTQQEAEFLHALGSDVYAISLCQNLTIDKKRTFGHKLYKIMSPTKRHSPAERVDSSVHPRLVQIIYNNDYPNISAAACENIPNLYSRTMANIGHIGKNAFYLDETNAKKLIQNCVEILLVQMERKEHLTFKNCAPLIEDLGDLKRFIDDETLLNFGLKENEK